MRIKELFVLMKEKTGKGGYQTPKAEIINILLGEAPAEGQVDTRRGAERPYRAIEVGPYAEPIRRGVEIKAETAPVGLFANREGDAITQAVGVLCHITESGYGFIRGYDFLTEVNENNIYISGKQIYRFGLKVGDEIAGVVKVSEEYGRKPALMYVDKVNGIVADVAKNRKPFEKLYPMFPQRMIPMETERENKVGRILDIVSPIGRGQRGLIVAPPMAGKTLLMKSIAKSILTNAPDMELIVLLVDERPEEVSDWQEWIGNRGKVLASSFDVNIENHIRLSEIVLEMAKRKVEAGKHVCILLDSLTRLARAYNNYMPSSGKTLSGGIDPIAIGPVKRFIGAARNTREGGSLTILATVLVETGSRMDDIIYEEFKGTGNMEVHLDRGLASKRMFPAVDIASSATRNEELLLSDDQRDAIWVMRTAFGNFTRENYLAELLERVGKTESNSALFNTVLSSRYAAGLQKEL